MTVQSLAREKRSRRHIRAPLLPQKYDQSDCHDSVSGAVFNLSTTIVGAGIMALPATIKVLGLIPGIVMILLAALLTEYSIGVLLRFGRAGYAVSPKVATANSYFGVVAEAFGGTGRMLSQVLIVSNNLGMLVVYMIIIGDVLSGTSSDGTHHPGVLEGWFGQQWWTRRSFILLLTTLFVFSPLISLKRLDSLSYTSALSVALAVVFVVITAAVAVLKLIDGSVGMPRLLPEINDQASFWKLFSTVPVLVTAYICHYNIFPIENELKDPTKMKSIVRTSLVMCSTVYVATSFFGFLLFGDDTLDDILANFDTDLELPHSALINDIVRVSYAVHLMMVFPIVFFSLRLNFDGLLFPHSGPISFDGRRFFSLTVVLMGVTFLGANYVPSIWDAFQFTGATATVSIGFIFPAAIALRDIYGIATKKDRILSWIMILLAVSSSTVALSSDIYSMFKEDDSPAI
ncbi:amino acid transporter AVT6A-like [Aristolochia californica]|uniref:amino acid transporter AVT6A-like n=1 Tax=Aristolochia californica TaxID=171875 RepID=UPI0035DDF499